MCFLFLFRIFVFHVDTVKIVAYSFLLLDQMIFAHNFAVQKYCSNSNDFYEAFLKKIKEKG